MKSDRQEIPNPRSHVIARALVYWARTREQADWEVRYYRPWIPKFLGLTNFSLFHCDTRFQELDEWSMVECTRFLIELCPLAALRHFEPRVIAWTLEKLPIREQREVAQILWTETTLHE